MERQKEGFRLNLDFAGSVAVGAEVRPPWAVRNSSPNPRSPSRAPRGSEHRFPNPATTKSTRCVTSTDVLSLSEPSHLPPEDPKPLLQGLLGQIEGKKSETPDVQGNVFIGPPGNRLGNADKKQGTREEREGPAG